MKLVIVWTRTFCPKSTVTFAKVVWVPDEQRGRILELSHPLNLPFFPPGCQWQIKVYFGIPDLKNVMLCWW